MENKLKISYLTINSNVKITQEMIKPIRTGIRINKRFFDRQPKKINIFVCNTEEEFKKYLGKYYLKWATGFVMPNTDINIKSPSLIQKIGKWKRKDFARIIIHELNHASYRYNIKKWNPNWLVEGIAIYASGQFDYSKKQLKEVIKKHKVDEKLLEYRYFKSRKTGHMPRYPIWAGFTRYLIKKYGEKDMIQLLKKISPLESRKQYDSAFMKIYGNKDKTIFKRFLESSNEKRI